MSLIKESPTHCILQVLCKKNYQKYTRHYRGETRYDNYPIYGVLLSEERCDQNLSRRKRRNHAKFESRKILGAHWSNKSERQKNKLYISTDAILYPIFLSHHMTHAHFLLLFAAVAGMRVGDDDTDTLLLRGSHTSRVCTVFFLLEFLFFFFHSRQH